MTCKLVLTDRSPDIRVGVGKRAPFKMVLTNRNPAIKVHGGLPETAVVRLAPFFRGDVGPAPTTEAIQGAVEAVMATREIQLLDVWGNIIGNIYGTLGS
jgi:hypothetical protein